MITYLNSTQINQTKRFLFSILNAISAIDLPTPAIYISLHELHDYLDSVGETGTVMLFIDKVFPLVESGTIEGSIPDMISQLEDIIIIKKARGVKE